MRPTDPNFYVAKGYAYPLTALAEMPDVWRRRTLSPGMWIWLAEVDFRTATLLVAGEDPWARLKPGQLLMEI